MVINDIVLQLFTSLQYGLWDGSGGKMMMVRKVVQTATEILRNSYCG